MNTPAPRPRRPLAAPSRSPAALLAVLSALALPACGGTGSPAEADAGDAGDERATDVTPAGDSASSDGSPADAQVACTETPVPADPQADARTRCTFAAGAHVADTLGIDAAARGRIPITHVVVVTQENRSFDHYFGRLAAHGQPDAEGFPATYANPDASGAAVAAHHLTSPCLPADPPHQWAAMHTMWNNGMMNGFVRNAATGGSDGRYAVGYYDAADLPFYYFMANTFALGDRYFGSALGGTWANRDYLYAGTSAGVHSTGERSIAGVRTIFDQLDAASVGWRVYTDGSPRQDCLGWSASHRGLGTFDTFLAQLGDGTLPPVSFVDPAGAQDEHPSNSVHGGEAWERQIYDTAIHSPLWAHLAVIFTYDEAGGLFDHVPPPSACLAAPDQTEFDRYGVRVPVIVVSPFARGHTVSHRVHDHTSTLRFIELLHDLPALTGRDANADALLDMFDFGCPALMTPPAAPAAGAGACN